METKICTKCKEELPIENFRWRSKKDNRRHAQCKKCQSIQEKAHYPERKEKILEHDKIYYKRNLEYIELQKACGCQKCGDKRLYALDFHHINPKDKTNTINHLKTYSLERLKQEIAKCKVLCSNCHREFHYLESLTGMTLEEYLKK